MEDDGSYEGVYIDLMFDTLDTDNDSFMSSTELEEIDSHWEELFEDGAIPTILSQMWNSTDTDGSGYIEYEEFDTMLTYSAWMADVEVPADDVKSTIFNNIMAGGTDTIAIDQEAAQRAMKTIMTAGLDALINANQ